MSFFRRHLTVKLFAANLVVVLVGVLVLMAAANLRVPNALDRHMVGMGRMVGGSGMMDELRLQFQAAFQDAITVGAIAATAAALIVAMLVSRRIVRPVEKMAAAAGRIARGDFHERVEVRADQDPEDFDELEQLAIRFNEMAAELERTEKRRMELVGNLAHEFRTPLSVIKGSLEGLMDGVLPPRPETYHQLHREAERLERLVSDLQELSRAEAGAVELDLKIVPAAELVDVVAMRLGPQFDQKGIALSTRVAAGTPPLKADRQRVIQVLTNLVGNALQYTPRGGHVRVDVDKIGEWVRFSVIDDGIGIEPEHLAHIFERFYRVEASRARAHGGSGLGLTISKHLIEAHGGKIWAESRGSDGGSAFHFELASAA